VYPESTTPDYSSILVPIIENVRMDYLIDLIAKQGKVSELISSFTVEMIEFFKRQSCSLESKAQQKQ